MNFIKRLQNKPYYVRVQIFWISVVLVMAIIVILWLVFLKSSLEFSEIKQEPIQEPTKEEKSIPSLFSSLKEDFSVFKKTLQAGVKGIFESSLEDNKEQFEFEAGIK